MTGAIAAGLCLPACDLDSPQLIDDVFTDAEWQKLSRFTPLPAPPASPTNRFADDPGAVALGQRLWFERRYAGPILAGSPAEGGLGQVGELGKISCADCHDPTGWFTDTRANNKLSLGAAWTKRNTPSVVNAAFYRWGGWSGVHDQVWKQAATVAENREAFNGDRLRLAHVIYQYYRDDYDALFDPDLDPALAPGDPSGRFPPSGKPKPSPSDPDGAWELMAPGDQHLVNTIAANIGKALEAYERRLVSGDAPFDRYVAGDHTALSASAKRGLRLFIGKAACDSCHTMETFTDHAFHNTGVPQAGAPFDLGRYEDVPRLESAFNGAGVFSDDRAAGSAKLDSIERNRTGAMEGQFRTKSLRHVAETGPYFHDGSMATLEDVVRFYNAGGGPTGSYPGVKNPRIVPLNLSDEEVLDLVEFLESLTGAPVPDELTRDTSAIEPVARLRTHIGAG